VIVPPKTNVGNILDTDLSRGDIDVLNIRGIGHVRVMGTGDIRQSRSPRLPKPLPKQSSTRSAAMPICNSFMVSPSFMHASGGRRTATAIPSPGAHSPIAPPGTLWGVRALSLRLSRAPAGYRSGIHALLSGRGFNIVYGRRTLRIARHVAAVAVKRYIDVFRNPSTMHNEPLQNRNTYHDRRSAAVLTRHPAEP